MEIDPDEVAACLDTCQRAGMTVEKIKAKRTAPVA